ncbi:MAG: RidA family protein [candidate division Zixibacteria bacterium]|nr:RidA family protein [candidate division Zixibacteria bacterium]
MNKRHNISSGAKWEDIVGYSRAVRIGNLIEISGTTAVDEAGKTVGINNPYEQTRFILQKIERALKSAGATIADVVRTRVYVMDITQWQEIGRAHAEYFKDIKPATSMIQISALIDPSLLVEIEVTAVVSDGIPDVS